MTKVWEEEWFIKNNSSCVDMLCRGDADDRRVIIAKAIEASGDGDPDDGARMLLAAAAPDLARMLMEHEFVSSDTDEGATAPRCPECEAYANYRWSVPQDTTSELLHDPHAPGCALDAALRKARGK